MVGWLGSRVIIRVTVLGTSSRLASPANASWTSEVASLKPYEAAIGVESTSFPALISTRTRGRALIAAKSPLLCPLICTVQKRVLIFLEPGVRVQVMSPLATALALAVGTISTIGTTISWGA